MAAPMTLGPLLAHLRVRRGWSQLRLAEHLCAASSVPTVSRHEVSRWERQERVPGDFWLSWLAAVLEVPLDELVAAARRSTPRRRVAPAGLVGLARVWAAGVDPGWAAIAGGRPAGVVDEAALRRHDDVLGGVDLLAAVRSVGPSQLLGWVLADAGDTAGAMAAYREALAGAAVAGDRALAGHVLGSASHLLAASGDARVAVALARAAVQGTRPIASSGLRALLLHRLTVAAAAAGHRAAGHEALLAARRAGDAADPGRDPPWLYWLDRAELDALAGRSLVALGRAAAARPLLVRAAARSGRPRTASFDRIGLARALLTLGAVDEACAVAAAALVDATRSGSVRAVDQFERLHRRLQVHHRHPAVVALGADLRAARPYLPRAARPAAAAGAS